MGMIYTIEGNLEMYFFWQVQRHDIRIDGKDLSDILRKELGENNVVALGDGALPPVKFPYGKVRITIETIL